MSSSTPLQAVRTVEADPTLPYGQDDRLVGYGAMGVPFASGHYLCLRDFRATSFGPAYRAIWHRDPAGDWTIYATQPPELSCSRFFGSAVTSVTVPQIDVDWLEDDVLEVTLGDRFRWQLELTATPATRMMTTMSGAMPEAAWTSEPVLASMGPMARACLRPGRIAMRGETPNGQHFQAGPRKVWRVTGGSATLDGVDLGALAPLDEQEHLADFWLPQRGLFFVGQARFSATLSA